MEVGKKYHMLTCLALDEEKGNPYYWVKCDCGTIKRVNAYSVNQGNTRSCGCLGKHNNLQHGFRHTRIYTIWRSMNHRCHNKNASNYARYGGKGISVCDEWRKFIPFKNWAMENGYTDNLTIDRIDPRGNYEPSNCRWATYLEQNNNRTSNKYIEYNGEVHTLSEWSRLTGIKAATLSQRLIVGWSIEDALTRKVRNSEIPQ